ncbi:YecH family metal-binding protein [Candidatus Neomarinimicrobiota bacterium]
MPKVMHAHGLLELLMESEGPVSREALRELVNERFGEDIYYTNCTRQLYTFDQMIEFLEAREKVVVENGSLEVQKHNVCEHD